MNLNFFTAKYPYTKGEPIVENEFPYLAASFEQVNIFPHLFEKQDYCRDTSKNASRHNLGEYKKVKLSWSWYWNIFYFYLLELSLAPNKKFYLKNSKLWLAYLKEAAKKAKYIEQTKVLLPNAVNYSYWMNDWALVLAFLKHRKCIDNFVFRCGGFDIWDERHAGNYLPFRNLIYKYANRVFPNAKVAGEYLQGKTKFKDKISVAYLGTNDHGFGAFVPDEKVLTIVSCASLIPLKRVHLMIDLLQELDQKVHWVHFGDGPERAAIESEAAKLTQHTVTFKGMVNNAAIMDYYKNNSVDLFITTSATEGLPVSIQEAISCGIPVIGTNVGGIYEIVNAQTGYLIPADFKIEEVVLLLKNWRNSKFYQASQRQVIRKFWQTNFDAQQVYPKFVDSIKKEKMS
ncbi:hypothetical protein DNU06_00255 [Putridiphycobacter roseus]|uniref:Glycosyl transferase family 1 domain-containing protein n=1 Tax=Putridiphycobacter roseus TaxID=2219161 RepID=A0A2W1NRQ1_9FLAO|nr:glycosyltransferase [Putridiphycobacter roseus]PZE18302.1 hypothetical protein DNU06_00255 [Putridiphycobacter roseus]